MSLKCINYILRIGEKAFSKDNFVERKPDDGERIIAGGVVFVFKKENKWQNLDTYQERKFQDMNIHSAEIVIGEIHQGLYQSFLEQDNRFFLESLEKKLFDFGWKELNPEQIRILDSWIQLPEEVESI